MSKDYIDALREAIRVRKDRVDSLLKMTDEIRASYKAMSPNQLNEAIRDVVGMQKEIAEHREFCMKARKEIESFFANPIKVA